MPSYAPYEAYCTECIERFYSRSGGARRQNWLAIINDCTKCEHTGLDPIPLTEVIRGYRILYDKL